MDTNTPIVLVLLVIAGVGVIAWWVEKHAPMSVPIKRIFIAVAVIALIVWLLQVFGIWALIMGATV